MVLSDPTDVDVGLEPVKSESDKKNYRLIYLSSGLRVLLIHDPSRKEDGDDESMMRDGDDERAALSDSDEEDCERVEDDDQKAAVALAVGVGSFCDPPYCEGLAHYCEHGLFMGSKKFPGENEYDAYVSLHGGSDNAMTEAECTVYYFDVVPSSLEGALDRFSQFFIEPLLRHESCARELQSIDEEFSLSRNNDGCRLQELQCHTSVDDHPCRKFCWGNTESLMTVPHSKGVDVTSSLRDFHRRYYKAPLMQLCVLGTQSLDELQEMVCRLFSGMCPEPVRLCDVENRPSGSEIEVCKNELSVVNHRLNGLKVCWKYFGNGHRRCQYLSFFGAGMSFIKCSAMVYRVRPVKDTNKLYIRWQLPPQFEHYRSDPCGYLAHVIGHEGRGSLYSVLQAKGWATGLVAGIFEEGHQRNTAFTIFTVSFILTEEGMNHWEDVVGLLFRLLSLLRKDPLPKWIQDELHRISQITFKFQEEMEPIDYVSDIVMQMLPALGLQEEHLLCSRYMCDEWQPELVEKVLHLLVPGTIRVEILSTRFGRAVGHEEEDKKKTMISSPTHDTTTRHTSLAAAATIVQDGRGAPLIDPHFGVEYLVDPISEEVVSRWEDAFFSVGNGKGLDSAAAAGAVDLTLPERNPFIPDDVTVKPLPPEHKFPLMETLQTSGPLSGISIPKTAPPAPEIVQMQCPPSSIVWYLQDCVFKQPKAEVRVKISFNEANTSAENSCCRDLLALLVQDSLTDVAYAASQAELHYSLKSPAYGFYLSFGGFSDKMLALAEMVVTRLLNFETHLKPRQFGAQRESLLRSIKNANLKSGCQVTNERHNVLTDKFWLEDQKLVATKALTVESMKLCLSRFFGKSVRIEALIHGNATQGDAKRLADIFQALTATTALSHAPGTFSDRPSVLCTGLQLLSCDPRDVIILLATRLVRVTPSKNPAEPNALEMYYQVVKRNIGRTLQGDLNAGVYEKVQALMEEPIFDELRTKQQLGYSVGCNIGDGYGTLSFTIHLQSASHDGLALVKHLREFLTSFAGMLSAMDNATFVKRVASLAHLKIQRDNELSEETYRHWKEISTKRHRFHSRFASARSLADISQDEVLCFFNQWFLDGWNSAGMLATLVHANDEIVCHEMATSIAAILEAKESSFFQKPQVMPLARKPASCRITRQGKTTTSPQTSQHCCLILSE